MLSKNKGFFLIITVSFIVLIITFILASVFGAAEVTTRDLFKALFTRETSTKINLLREIRLPRVVGALLVGASLGVAGCIMQGLTRNPLADPSLLGLSAGASLALALTLVYYPKASTIIIMCFCFIGALIATLMVLSLGRTKRVGFSPYRLVLAGVCVTTLLTAITEGVGLHFKISKHISMWTSGGLVGTTWQQLSIIGPVIIICLVIALVVSKELTILSLSEEVAIGLGQKTERIKLLLLIITIILASSSVALVGNLAFLGLIIPHISRFLTGPDYRKIIPVTILMGASLMTLADLVARTINAPFETPVVAILAILGLPFFLIIMRKGVKGWS